MSTDLSYDKEAALNSDRGSAPPGAIDLNAQRRAALAEVDNVSCQTEPRLRMRAHLNLLSNLPHRPRCVSTRTSQPLGPDEYLSTTRKQFGWFHVRACLVAGVGFYTDAYDVSEQAEGQSKRSLTLGQPKIFAINLASTMIGYVYNQGLHKGKLTANQ